MRKSFLFALILILILSATIGTVCRAEAAPAGGERGWTEKILEGPVKDLLTYLYTAARWTGSKLRTGMNALLPPKAKMPPSLDDPLGVLLLLTVFLAVAEVAKKVTWFLVAVGWALMLVRVGIILAQSYL